MGSSLELQIYFGVAMPGFEPYAIFMVIAFVIGYALITLEHITKINKAAIALLMAIVCWALVFVYHPCPENSECYLSNLAEISQIVFFLIGALTIVEIISTHHGFNVVSDLISVKSKRQLLWVMGIITFILSSILDNLTTTIVMITLLQKLLPKSDDRWTIGGAIVIAANAGGAWTPIGDVTTTMLWIGGQLTTEHMIPALVIPSVVCMAVSFLILTFMLKGGEETASTVQVQRTSQPFEKLVFFLGVSALVFVPVFKMMTGLAPLMGILLGLSILWIVTDALHGTQERPHLQVPSALSRIDLASVLFFLGILLCVAALGLAGILEHSAQWLDRTIGNTTIIATLIGIISAIIDNVPLVAATMEMYPMSQHPVDSQLWDLIAYCAGTGGSILIIGSAAGVMFMGLENVNFFWYLRRISLPALAGYLAGIGAYLLIR